MPGAVVGEAIGTIVGAGLFGYALAVGVNDAYYRTRCGGAKIKCIDKCSAETLSTKNFGASFRCCISDCMKAAGCKVQ